ncbi:MAG: hypothetical protein COY40_05060 [Alphaproteobacteria bacterium CG_4_10_14_0_8_um_filter_53_9]|nr:MAG: hypothetical protein COY40_05060 [Alphaproteobacteria bacterium CG_4_10_14_0_8_um_filter_53_9]
MRVLINAMHTSGGGGLVYLNGILPHVPRDWELLISPDMASKITVPEGMAVRVTPKLGFFGKHVYEQFVLPILQRRWGFDAMLCNANYGPLFARRLVPIVHTTPRAAGAAKTLKMRLYWSFLVLLTKMSLARAWRVLVVAEHVLADYGGKNLMNKAVVAHPGKPEWDKNTPFKKDEQLLLAVGDVYAQKNYPTLVQAVVRLRRERPDVRLVIVGRPVDAAAVRALDKAVEAHQAEGFVEVRGGVPHDDLLALMAQAAVLVSVSRAECFNLPLLEALTVGTPVVCGDDDFFTEVVGTSAAVRLGLCEGAVADAVAVAIFALLESKPLCDQLIRAGYVRAGLFDWRLTGQKITYTFAV